METKSVSEFNRWLKVAFDFVNTRLNFVIRGEISSINVHHSGHVYATLKENNDSVKIIIWRSVYQRKNLVLEVGQNIEIIGKLNYYEPTSTISLVVSNFNFIDENGLLKKKLLETETKYANLGYFNQSNKKQIPSQIKNVAIVTAKTGDAINDIVKTFNRRNPSINLVLYPSLVQGIDAKFEIAKQIRYINSQTKYNFDAIIVGRGGGSFEDLFAFNESEVIEAIFESNIFVVSAVGHEADVLLSDKVADIRASTPTAAAELLTSKTLSDYENEISYIINYLELSLTSKIEAKYKHIQNFDFQNQLHRKIELYKYNIDFSNVNLNDKIVTKIKTIEGFDFSSLIELKLKNQKQRISFDIKLDDVKNIISRKLEKLRKWDDFKNVEYKLESYLQTVNNLDEMISSLGPKSLLTRGFSIITNEEGEVVKKSTDLPEKFNIQFIDKKIKAKKV